VQREAHFLGLLRPEKVRRLRAAVPLLKKFHEAVLRASTGPSESDIEIESDWYCEGLLEIPSEDWYCAGLLKLIGAIASAEGVCLFCWSATT
jgi:hypothetical protein